MRYEEALPFFEKMLESHIRNLGEEHSDVAILINNLGYALLKLERYEQSEQAYQKSFLLMRTLFGDEHPNTIFVHKKLMLVQRLKNEEND